MHHDSSKPVAAVPAGGFLTRSKTTHTQNERSKTRDTFVQQNTGVETHLPRPFTSRTFPKRLTEFRSLMSEITLQNTKATTEERRELITEHLGFYQFVEAIRTLLGSDLDDRDLKTIYKKISTNPDAKVDWGEVFGYFQEGGSRLSVPEDTGVFLLSQKKRFGDAAGTRKCRDVGKKLVHIEDLDLYLLASQKGAITLWSTKTLRLQFFLHIKESSWLTGCTYAKSLRKVIISTERGILIWDHRASGKSNGMFFIPIPDVSISCICSAPLPENYGEGLLMYGDDAGHVHVLQVSVKDMSIGSDNSKTVIPLKKLSHVPISRRLHPSGVNQIKYFFSSGYFASCSSSPEGSFVLANVEKYLKHGEYQSVNIPKGVNCFVHANRANVIATGGADKIIRVWHPNIFSKPTGTLTGHLFSVIDITCNESDQHLISISSARVFRVWDLHTLTCLQVFTDNSANQSDRTVASILFDNRQDVLISASAFLEMWPLTRAIQDSIQVPMTHDRPIMHMLTSCGNSQVVTVCSSAIKTWECEYGRLVYSIPQAHNATVTICAIALAETGYRMATAGSDGYLKIWDFGSGQEIKSTQVLRQRSSSENDRIVSLHYVQSERGARHILVVQASDLISVYAEINSKSDLEEIKHYSGVNLREKGHPETEQKDSNEEPNMQSNEIQEGEVIICSALINCNTLALGYNSGSTLLCDPLTAMLKKSLKIPSRGEDAEKSDAIKEETKKNGEKDDVSMTSRTSMSTVKSSCDPLPSIGYDPRNSNKNTPSDLLKTNCIQGVRIEVNRQKSKSNGSEHDNKEENKLTNDITEATVNIEDIDSDVSRQDDPTIKGHSIEGCEESQIEFFIITGHGDGYLRFWKENGTFICECPMVTRGRQVGITCMSFGGKEKVLYVADTLGYCSIWSIKELQLCHGNKTQNTPQQMLSWRAHMSRVTHIVCNETLRIVITSSSDSSARVWHSQGGNYIGFLGQSHPLNLVRMKEDDRRFQTPYDISERPLVPARRVERQERFSLNPPLVFMEEKWNSLRKSSPKKKSSLKDADKNNHFPTLENKRFFGALIKPKAYPFYPGSSISSTSTQGAVFGSLPIYTVKPTDSIKPNKKKLAIFNKYDPIPQITNTARISY